MNISKAVYGYDVSGCGDRVDALTGLDGNWHLIVLDACGHGAAAGKLASDTLHFVKSCLWRGLTPASVFRSLNARLLATSSDREGISFGSGAIVTLDSHTSVATFASAGHVDVLRFNSDGRRHYHLRPTGPLYGVFCEAQYYDEVVPYAAGDSFVLMTDGLLDAPSIDGRNRFIGIDGICSLIHGILRSTGGISAQELISAVESVTRGFRDDVAAIVAITRAVDALRVDGKDRIAS